MIFVGGLRHVPVMFLLLAGALRSMDPSLEDSSATCGSGNSSTMLRITFPLMLPASAAAVIYSFINAVESFEIPALIGIPVRIYVFSTKIGRVLAPLLIPAFASGFLYIFSHIIRDFSLAILLYSPRRNVLAVVIWELWQAGTIAQVGAMSVMLVVLLGIVTFAGRKYLQRVSLA
jgi:ABC-type Fe3+ transport system permease subunit